jgi:integrase
MSGKRIGVPTAIISQSLGHKTEQTTQIYLDSFDNETVDKFHEKIIKLK